MLDIHWKQILIGEEKFGFLIEIALRTVIIYFIILFGLRLLGKRGIRQLSVFELVVIISLGSAAGDPMFYKEIGLLTPVVIFMIIVGAYRFTTYLTAKSEKIDDLIEGKSVYLIRGGKFNIEDFKKEALAKDEFFAELRQQSVSHLGQIETAILETSGILSVYFYPDEEVRYGLPILPDLFEEKVEIVKEDGHYACSFCGTVEEIITTGKHSCKKCKKEEWVKAIDRCRVH